MCEVEIASWLDERDKHTGRGWIWYYMLNFSDRKVTARLMNLTWFIIDDPVANAGLNTTEILARKLIALGWTVIID